MKLSRRAWAYYLGFYSSAAKVAAKDVKVMTKESEEKNLEKAVEERKHTCTCAITCSVSLNMKCPIHG